MLDIRYHIVYLCAIFLMLGFGILIGESLYGPVQVRQQATTLANLRVQVDGAVQEGKQAKERLVKIESGIDRLRPTLVRQKLMGKHVVIIQTGDASETTTTTRNALTDAGASIVDVVTIGDQIGSLTPKQQAALAAVLPATVTTDANGTAKPITQTGVLSAIATLCTQGTEANPDNLQVIQVLETQDLIHVSGDLSSPCHLFVFVGGINDDSTARSSLDMANSVDIPLMDQLNTLTTGHVTIVGCESSQATISFMRTYQNYGIATIDCVDLPIGELALPFALHGGIDKDDYGLKSTARRQIPVSLEGQSNT